MDISIIIPTTSDRDYIFNNTLLNAIDAVKEITAEIIVISDSINYVPDIPAENYLVKVYNNPGKGVASARNYGATLASGNLLLFLDNDIIISGESLIRTITFHQTMQNACLNPNWIYPGELENNLKKSNFGRFLQNYGMTTLKGWHGNKDWIDDNIFESKSIASFHLSLSKRDFQKSGGYNTSFPYAGFEDYEFSKKMKAIGLEFYIDSRITVLHNEADKLDIYTRFRTQEFRSTTRKIAVLLGNDDVILHYGTFKHIILSIIYFFKKPIIGIMKNLPTSKFFYKIYVILYKLVEASVIYKGYVRNSFDK